MGIMYRPHVGSFTESMEAAQPCNTWQELCEIVASTDVVVKRYRHDIRNNWNTFIVEAGGLPVGFLSGELKPC